MCCVVLLLCCLPPAGVWVCQGTSSPSGDTKVVTALRGEVDRLTAEREAILRNWRVENDRMTAAWQQERQAWLSERDGLLSKVCVGELLY